MGFPILPPPVLGLTWFRLTSACWWGCWCGARSGHPVRQGCDGHPGGAGKRLAGRHSDIFVARPRRWLYQGGVTDERDRPCAGPAVAMEGQQGCFFFNRSSKSPAMAFPTLETVDSIFCFPGIFNGLGSLKMEVHPCTEQRVSKAHGFWHTADGLLAAVRPM